jgi:hypothetical protein
MILFFIAGSACASQFWRQVEPFFGFLMTEDVAYLSQQVTWGGFYVVAKEVYLHFSRLIYYFLTKIHSSDDSISCRSVEGDESQKHKVYFAFILCRSSKSVVLCS